MVNPALGPPVWQTDERAIVYSDYKLTKPFLHNIGVWQTDAQTDRHLATAELALSITWHGKTHAR